MNIGLYAHIACILEATARKPGNVHREADFAGDAHYLDFLLSATAIAEPMNRAREVGVGATVLAAVQATRHVVSTNTNLGIILLFAPLACVPDGVEIREGVRAVLEALTVADARAVYQAIRLAGAGGLGEVPDQDIAAPPTVTLLEAMKMASERDIVARQYATGYAQVFEVTLPALLGKSAPSFQGGRNTEASIIHAYLKTLAHTPDTLIARKRGEQVANEASLRAAQALAIGNLDQLDAWLREDGHARNPGATADLVAAALFVALRDGTIPLPITGHGWDGLSLPPL